MSNYTMTLKRVIDIYGYEEVVSWFESYDLRDYLTAEQVQVIEDSDLWRKDKLSPLILEHYLMREIAYETPYLFRHFAKVRMSEIMEKYAPLIYAQALQMSFNPLTQNQSFQETESYTKTNEDSSSSSSSNSGSSSSSTSQEGNSLSVHSDTPQGQISKSSILAGNYATDTEAQETENSASDSTSTSSQGTAEGSSEGTETFSRTKSGFSLKMTKADLIMNYRKSIISLNMQIIEELNSLFFALF